MNPISQRDPRWKDIKLGTGDSTIGKEGCTICCLAYVLQTTPDIVNQKLIDGGGYTNGDLVTWSKLKSIFPVITEVRRVTAYNNSDVAANIPCLVEVNGAPIGSAKHWVVYIGNKMLMDPWFGTMKNTGFYAPTGYAVVKTSIINPESMSTQAPMITDDTILDLPAPWNKISVRDVKSNLASQVITIEALTKVKEDNLTEIKALQVESAGWKTKYDNLLAIIAKKLGTTQDEPRVEAELDRLIAAGDKLQNISDSRPVTSATPIHKLLESILAYLKKLLIKNKK